ncbi:MAG: hypothetical protein IT445_15515 [Phycisphaeraceae bacterium]|nr:hypothetical protein [Phycisphaeraceae bacterium]
MRRVRSWMAVCLLVALAGASFYFGNLIDLSATTFSIGMGSVPRANFDDSPFSIGSPQRYREPGVYLDYLNAHGVIIVSHTGMVVALSAHNPTTGKAVRYEQLTSQFSDPATGARFNRDGIITSLNRAQRRILDDNDLARDALDENPTMLRSLERCYIRLRQTDSDRDQELIVDPRHRFIFELNQWSREFCCYLLNSQ